MIKYEDLTKPFATGVIPDGYFGATTKVEFHHDPESFATLAKHSSGYFHYHTPPALDENEAFWLLGHHPSSNASLLRRL